MCLEILDEKSGITGNHRCGHRGHTKPHVTVVILLYHRVISGKFSRCTVKIPVCVEKGRISILVTQYC